MQKITFNFPPTSAQSVKMRLATLAFALLAIMVVAPASGADLGSPPPTGAQHCGDNINKVTSCLGYVTGKADEPVKPCCDAVGEMKESEPACLCYIMQQTHNGTQQMVKSAGILESRLLQLPSACNLKNASISDCPKLLGIPPTSPDYAIFTNATSNATTTSITTATPASSGSPDKVEEGRLRLRNASILAFAAVLSLVVYI